MSRACGSVQAAVDPARAVADIDCWGYQTLCRQPGATQPGITARVVVSKVYSTRTGRLLRVQGSCGATPTTAGPALAGIRDEVTRHAPAPATHTGGTAYLLHAAVVFTTTGPHGQPLTDIRFRFPLAGHTLTATLHLTRTVWTWGDGTTTTRTSGDLTGHPYSDTEPCETAELCTHYIAHTYTRPGPVTIGIDATWTATVTIDDNPTQIPVAGDVHRTDTAGRTITIHPAHAILVGN